MSQARDESPFLPERLLALFVRPREFFVDPWNLARAVNVAIVGWIVGMSNAADRIDAQILKQRGATDAWPWRTYWSVLAGGGVVGGLGAWYVAGWWYCKRVQLSGADSPDPRIARAIYLWSTFVYAAPAVLIAVYQSARYESYSAAYAAEDPITLLVLVFVGWSTFVSYAGVLCTFPVDRKKARLWFLVLPLSAYAVIFGGAATLLSVLQR
jgi:hypothetical protein